MNGSDAIKKYQTHIKSAQGVVVLAVILNLIYILRAFIAKNLSFWFSTYLTEFMMKSSGFSPEIEGGISKGISIVIILLQLVLFLISAILSQNNGKLLYLSLAVYLADTAFMAVGYITDIFGDFCEADLINVIYHFFVIVFILGGIYGYSKLKKLMVNK